MTVPFERSQESAFYEGDGVLILRGKSSPEGRQVLLKALDVRHLGARAQVRLKTELEIGRGLETPAAVKPLALVGNYEGMPALLLEDSGGEPLRRVFRFPIPTERFLSLSIRIAEAVAEVHRRGVVHQNIRPDSILVHPQNEEVKLTDLGMASRVSRTTQISPSTSVLEGALPYLSPEQTGRVHGAVDARADLYALGITFYELLTGRLPFAGRDLLEWVHWHLTQRPIPPTDVQPSVSKALSDIVLKLCAKLPEERYQTATGLQHDLERCLTMLRTTGRMEAFVLGETDISDRFQIPQRLYGREEEVAALLSAYERVVENGKPELVLVSGYAGVGKSSLVAELHRPIVRERGLYASAKFERYKRDIPYATAAQAFRELLLDVVARGEEHIASWRGQLKEALGLSGQLVVEVIPQLELLMGKQPAVPEQPAREAENRFREVFRRFVGVFARQEHPLVLFLDDLQWADSASLKLLSDLVTHPGMQFLTVVGAYRDNEVSPSHPLRLTLEQARRDGAAIQEIILQPLKAEHLGQLIADTVRQSCDQVAPLSRLVHEKTGGNPYFAIQFLTLLHEEKLLVFDSVKQSWRWELQDIRAKGYTDNVVDLMVQKLTRLPAATQEAVKLFACIGNSAEAPLFALVQERSQERVHQELDPALDEGLLMQKGEVYRFAHDRVHEAAYSLVPPNELPAVHLHIGRLLLTHLSEDLLQERVFEVVGQFSHSLHLLTEAERESVFQLSALAGRKAKAATAYVAARNYLAQSLSLLPADAWRTRYEEVFALALELYECEFSIGDFQRADPLHASLLDHARTNLDRARAYRLQLRRYFLAGEHHNALKASLDSLRILGVTFPESEEALQTTTSAELQELREALRGRRIADLVDAPEPKDPDVRMIITLLVESIFSTIMTVHPQYFPLFAARAVSFSLRYGNTAESCQAYSFYAHWLTSTDDIQTAFELSEMSLRLSEKFNNPALRGRLLYTHGGFIETWRRPIASAMRSLEQSFLACQQVGDYSLAAFPVVHASSDALVRGEPLDQVLEEARRATVFAHETHNEMLSTVSRLLIPQLIACLKGRTRSLTSFDDENFDEAATVEMFKRSGYVVMAGAFYVLKQTATVIYGQYQEALEAAGPSAAWVGTVGLFELEQHFYQALTLTALYPQAPAEQQQEFLQALRKPLHRLELAAQNCPENSLSRFALVKAEVARIEGRELEAMRLYEQAIRTARENGFVQIEALAYEIASKFYRSLGFESFAHNYLREARGCYLRWGADGKVKQLDRLHPELVERRPLAESEQLDLLAVAKASQTISSEVVPEKLVRALLEVVLEQSGAQRAYLVFVENGHLKLAADAVVDERLGLKTVAHDALPVEVSTRLPISLLQYVRRTKERVLLPDATVDIGRFGTDAYFSKRRPKSILCQPILREGEVVGLLYLENDLLPGAFTTDRLAMLEVLAAQSSISLQVAQLLSREQMERKAAAEAERRAAFLSEASQILGESLNPEEVFRGLAQLAVHSLADWTVIDLIENREIRRVAAVHRDPGKQKLLDEYRQRYPLTRGSPSPVLGVLESGRAMLFPVISDPEVRVFCVDDVEARLVREAGARSAIVVPLVARGQILGMIALVSAQAGHYKQADVELGQELGRRAAVAIENARLHRETQEAVRLRDEFLSVASHELRTPITSLQLALQGLTRGVASPSPDHLNRVFGMAERQAGRLTRLVEELLEVSRIQAGRIALRLESVDLAAVVREVALRFEGELERTGCELSLRAPDSVVGRWDSSRLEQVVTNVLSNAIKFGVGRPIEIVVEEAPIGMGRLVVTDHGIGIPPARLPFVFDRFERAVSAQKYGGLGLGLFIVRSIVESLGGKVRAESTLGIGSTFTAELPCAGPPVATA